MRATRGRRSLLTDMVLVAAGRRANCEGLRPEAAGLRTEQGCLVTDEKGRTNVPHIYAAGDVTGKIQLAHAASREAEIAVEEMFGLDTGLTLGAVPGCIFTHPEIAFAGLTEEDAKRPVIKRGSAASRLPQTGRRSLKGNRTVL